MCLTKPFRRELQEGEVKTQNGLAAQKGKRSWYVNICANECVNFFFLGFIIFKKHEIYLLKHFKYAIK